MNNKEIEKILLEKFPERITSKIEESDNWYDGTKCWDWQGATSHGYGVVGYFGNLKRVHKLSCELFKGEIPKNMVVRHLCNRRICCNPAHLAAGSYSENQKDIYNSGNRKTYKTNRRAKSSSTITGEELIEWVKNNIVKIDENQCWIVVLGQGQEYANLNIGKKSVKLHRYLYCIRAGMNYDDDTWHARHRCNVKDCVNPDHILKGTRSENAIDFRSYSTQVKIDEKSAIMIAQDYVSTRFDEFGSLNMFYKKWADYFGLSNNSTIQDIVKGRTWSDVTNEILKEKKEIWKPRTPKTKLTPNIVNDIRKDMNNWDFSVRGEKNKFNKHWANIYGVGITAINDIRGEVSWANVVMFENSNIDVIK